MNYVVFDLEWNQGTAQTTVEEIPFEIVEIGAVRLNDGLEITGTFQILVNPVVYKVINYQTHKVMPLTMDELREGGVSFRQAAERFFEWCGESGSYRFCTWGSTDLTQLQKNLDYFDMPFPGHTPIKYYDIQRCFDLSSHENGKHNCVALEDAVSQLGIEKNSSFHRALGDAEYTAAVMQHLDIELIRQYFSLDYYHNPKTRDEEILVHYPDYTLFVSREFEDREELMKDAEVRSTRCCICNRTIRRRIRWYCFGRGVYRCLARCEKHGMVSGRIRLKSTLQSGFYVEKILKMAEPEEVQYITERRNELRKRRREKNRAAHSKEKK